MFGNRKVRSQQPSPYTTRAEFCQIYEKDMNRLYRLSFLLTGDATMAEQCFVGGLHIAQESSPVFKEWAESWARRSIILNAIRMIRPRATSGFGPEAGDRSVSQTAGRSAGLDEVVQLPAIERFVFVMSVLERYSDQECALLLGCTRSDITAARSRALHQLGKTAELRDNVVSIGSEKETLPDHMKAKLQPEIFSGLAASA